MSQKHIVIIGNGITGTTCAREIRKRSNHRITMISQESDYFFSRPALMYIFMGSMRLEHTYPYEAGFWKKNRIELVRDEVLRIDRSQKILSLAKGGSIAYDQLVLATGSQPNAFGWPGQDLPGVQGLYSVQDLELLEENCRRAERAVIVGGGLIGVELAEMLLSRGIRVTFLVRENNFWDIVLPVEEARLVGDHIQQHGIDLLLATELSALEAGLNGRVGFALTRAGETIPCELVGLTVGVSPRVDLARACGLEVDRGILVTPELGSSDPFVFAAGDCAQHRLPPPDRRSVEQVWYTGRLQAETLAAHLCGENVSYNPGTWFNSAKFFDLEYQVYGQVPPALPGHLGTWYGQDRKTTRSLRLVFEKKGPRVEEAGALVGIQGIGIRLRQDVCTRWIEKSTPAAIALSEIRQALFDPEFAADPIQVLQMEKVARSPIHV